MRPFVNTERDAAIIAAFHNGASLGDLSAEYGVTVPRIHQIVYPRGVSASQVAKPRALSKYAESLGDLYDQMPKEVIAAIAVSYASLCGDHLNLAREVILEEWWELYEKTIVHQKPPFPRPKDVK